MNFAPERPGPPDPDAWEVFRTELVDKTLRAFYLLGWVGLPVFIWRSTVVGWNPGSAIVVVLVVAGMIFQRFGQRASTDLKSLVLVSAFFAIATPGLFNLGLLSNGLLLVASGCMAASLVFSRRVSIAFSAVAFVLLIAAGIGFISGLLVVHIDANAFVASPAAWATAVGVNFLSALILINSVAAFRSSLQTLLVEVQRQRDLIAHQANHDPLTHLPTVGLASDRLDMALHAARRESTRVAVMFLDLDGFKAANDTFGHDAGDHVLRVVATRIRSSIRATDTASRIGGDEFLVVLTSIPDATVAAETAHKIIGVIGRPITVGSQQVQVGCSIGIALFPDHGSDRQALRHAADMAMYAVKRAGRNGYAFPQPEAALPASRPSADAPMP